MKECLKSKMAGILLSLLLILGCVFVLVHPKSNQHKKTEPASKYVESGNIKNVSYWGDHNEYILAKDFYFVGNRYLLTFEFYTNKNGDKKENYTGFLAYDAKNNLNKNKVEVLKEIRKKYPKAFLAREGSNYGIINRNGKNLVWMRFFKTPTSEEYNEIFYDLDKQMFVQEDSINSDYLQIDSVVISYTNLGGIVVDETGYNIGSGIRRNRYSKINKDDLNIFKEHPELKEKLSKEGYTLYPRQDSISNAEYFDQLLHWFAPTGQDRISGVKIDAYYSKDGQEHEIHSYEEFKQYYNGKGGELQD